MASHKGGAVKIALLNNKNIECICYINKHTCM